MADQRRSLETLAESESRLNALLDAAPFGIGFWDRELRFRRLNSCLAEIDGLPVEAHLGKRPDELHPDLDGLDRLLDQWVEVMKTECPLLDLEVRGKTPADPRSERVRLEDFLPVRLQDEVIGIGAVLEEVTERRASMIILRSRVTETRDEYNCSNGERGKFYRKDGGMTSWRCSMSGYRPGPPPPLMVSTRISVLLKSTPVAADIRWIKIRRDANVCSNCQLRAIRGR